jgi:hypothetical protein
MTDPKLAAIVCLCVLAVLAGCVTDTNQPASANIFLEEVSTQGETVHVSGNVTLNSGTHNVTLHEVVLVVVADNGSTMRTIQIGTLGAAPYDRYDRAGFHITVSKPPMELRLSIGRVTNPENADFGVGGRRLENKETLRYGPFTQDEY